MTPREGAALGSLLGLVVGAIGADLVTALFVPDTASMRKADKVSRGAVAFGAVGGTLVGAIIGAGDPPPSSASAPPAIAAGHGYGPMQGTT